MAVADRPDWPEFNNKRRCYCPIDTDMSSIQNGSQPLAIDPDLNRQNPKIERTGMKLPSGTGTMR